jgi:hypothetical protein
LLISARKQTLWPLPVPPSGFPVDENQLVLSDWTPNSYASCTNVMNSNSGVTRKGASLVFLEVPDTRQCSWLRHYSTSQKDAGCIPDEVPEFFQSVCY